jgi:ABC-type nitrate/sulfonate/bicarbonate transport system substrate-binding protein
LRAIIFLLVVGLTVLVSGGCSPGGSGRQPELITIGSLKDLTGGPAVIADDRGYFKDNGFDVQFVRFETGAQSSEALIRGEVDIAYMAEYIMVRNTLDRQPVRVIASDSNYESVLLAARKSSGISSIAGLKGQKIGVAVQTINLFYLDRLLENEGLGIKDVTPVDGTQAQLIQQYNQGELNAVVFSRIWVNQLQPQSDLVIWSAQGNQTGYRLVVARREWVEQHPDLILRFLKSLDSAINFILNNQAEARAIIQKQLDLSAGYIETEWPVTHFGLSLNLSLLAAMNDEARWMIQNGLTMEKDIPDFAAYFYLDGLRTVKPEAVNIVR